MTKHEKLKNLSGQKFKRATGVGKKTFKAMLKEINNAEKKRKNKAKGRGRKAKLSIDDQLLMVLEYWREYRTQFHLSVDYGINESGVNRTIKRIEDILIKSDKFHLPGKKELTKTDVEFEIVLVDVTETPIERPKKNKNNSIAERRKNTH